MKERYRFSAHEEQVSPTSSDPALHGVAPSCRMRKIKGDRGMVVSVNVTASVLSSRRKTDTEDMVPDKRIWLLGYRRTSFSFVKSVGVRK